VYLATGDPEQMKHSAARHLLQTFFAGSAESAVVAMLGATDKPLTNDELDRIAALIEKARRKGGGGRR
jgi:hypothetical protein